MIPKKSTPFAACCPDWGESMRGWFSSVRLDSCEGDGFWEPPCHGKRASLSSIDGQ